VRNDTGESGVQSPAAEVCEVLCLIGLDLKGPEQQADPLVVGLDLLGLLQQRSDLRSDFERQLLFPLGPLRTDERDGVCCAVRPILPPASLILVVLCWYSSDSACLVRRREDIKDTNRSI